MMVVKKSKLGARKERPGLWLVKGVRCFMLLDNVFSDGISNEVRFVGVLEKLITSIRVYNFVMERFAPNQQYLCCQETDIEFEHDLIIIAPAIETIRKLSDSLLTFKKGIISL